MKFKELTETKFKEKFYDNDGNLASEFQIKMRTDGEVPFSPIFHAKKGLQGYIVHCPDGRVRFYTSVQEVKRKGDRPATTEAYKLALEAWDDHHKAFAGSPIVWHGKTGGVQGAALKRILKKIEKRLEFNEVVVSPENIVLYWEQIIRTRPKWKDFWKTSFDLNFIDKYFTDIITYVGQKTQPTRHSAERAARSAIEKHFGSTSK